MRRWRLQYALNLKITSTVLSILLALSNLMGTVYASGVALFRLLMVFYVQTKLDNRICPQGT